MSKIEIYKNRYGGDPLVVGELRQTKGSMYTGVIWAPYIPLMITPVVKNHSWFARLKYKFQWWFYEFCFYNFKSEYIRECMVDFYIRHGSRHLIMMDTKVNPDYYSKITINDAEN